MLLLFPNPWAVLSLQLSGVTRASTPAMTRAEVSHRLGAQILLDLKSSRFTATSEVPRSAAITPKTCLKDRCGRFSLPVTAMMTMVVMSFRPRPLGSSVSQLRRTAPVADQHRHQ